MSVQPIQPVNPTPLPGAMTVANPNQRTVNDVEAVAFAQQVGSNSVSSVGSEKQDFSNATMEEAMKLISESILFQGLNQAADDRQKMKEAMEEQS
jgi:hypothetical protein